MNTPSQPTGLKITPGDILYTLFRHKKKIIIFALLGVVAGATAFKLTPLPFVSSAKLLVRYVTDKGDLVTLENSNANYQTPGGPRTNSVMSSELEILSSSDISFSVAEKIGPQNIIELKEGATQADNLYNAAAYIASHLFLDLTGKDSSVIMLTFSHNKSEVAQNVLQSTIEDYLKKHVEFHSTTEAFNNSLLQQADQLKARLAQTEEELLKARQKAGVISLIDAKIGLSQEIARLRNSIFQTDAELAEYITALQAYEQIQGPTIPQSEDSDVEDGNEQPDIDFEKLAKAIENYEGARSALNVLRSREQVLLMQFTEENSRVKSIRAQIENSLATLEKIEEENPNVRATSLTSNTSSEKGFNPNLEIQVQSIRIRALQARSETLKNQHEQLKAEAAKIDLVEVEINALERRRELEESHYKNLVISLESTRLEDDLRAGKANNIRIIQKPSLGVIEIKKKLQVAGGLTVGIGIIGLVWALLVDLLIDRSIKRPTEIQRNLGIPLFMNLPDLNDKRFGKANAKTSRQHRLQAAKLQQQETAKKLPAYNPKSPTLQAAALARPEQYGKSIADTKTIAPWDDKHALNEHFEALRDKVITYFESKNLTHKPKLIALTGLGEKSGVTTIASGLAGSLSKIGEGNVLLVDMTLGHETAQQFYHGKNILNLDEVLDSSTDAKVENNLYVVAEGANGMKMPRIMPQRFNKIMPKLRASDFDYIIFDMPPVSPISSTPRLASFMDIVLMVLESEQTSRDTANQAIELLSESKAHLGGILNKTKPHVPRKLEQDLLSQA